jgi:hypothetical protein
MKQIYGFKDGVLGLIGSIAGGVRALLTFAVVIGVFAGLWAAWKSVTLVSISNQSDVPVHDVVLNHKPYEGEEQLLWRVSLHPKQSTFRLSMGCCWRLVVRHESRATSCRYPSFAPATFKVIVDEDLNLTCGGMHRTLLP